MNLSHLLLTATLSAAVAFGVSKYAAPVGGEAIKKETAFERVMRTNTLKCGYYIYTPITIKDPNTGKLSGFSVDMMGYLGQKTGLKIEWVEEITFGNWVQAIQAGKFDAVCTPLWPDVAPYRVAKFSRPLFYTDLLPIVRADETRFGDDLSTFNNPELTIGSMQGDVANRIVSAAFPKAKHVTIPSSTDYATLLQDLIAKKVDMVPWERNSVYYFNQKNPAKVKPLATKEPIGFMPSELVVAAKDGDLLDMFNGLIEEMQNTGELKRLTEKWLVPGIVLYPAKPYEPADTSLISINDLTPLTSQAKP